MSTIELSDRDGDAFTLSIHGGSAWITCTSGRDEVTVGPFSPRLLRSVLGSAALEEESPDLDVAARERSDSVIERHFAWSSWAS